MAEGALEQRVSLHERSYRGCSVSSILAHKGVDALLLKDYDRALRLLEKGLKNFNPTQIPAHARLLARKAEAYYGLRLIDECATTAEQSLVLAQSVGASNTITRLKSLHTTLEMSEWKMEPAVRRLGVLLAKS